MLNDSHHCALLLTQIDIREFLSEKNELKFETTFRNLTQLPWISFFEARWLLIQPSVDSTSNAWWTKEIYRTECPSNSNQFTNTTKFTTVRALEKHLLWQRQGLLHPANVSILFLLWIVVSWIKAFLRIRKCPDGAWIWKWVIIDYKLAF